MAESITFTDNRTGESFEVPIVDGGVDATEWKKHLPGLWFYDPALDTTAVTSSAITYLDGEAGILRYRGYPIEQLAEQSNYLEVAYLLIHGELPTAEQYEAWVHDITYHTFIHENVRKRFLEGFHHDAHPMGMLVSAIAALSTFYPDAGEIHDHENRLKQIVRLIAKMPTLAAACHRFSVGMPFVYPDNSLGFTANFLSMLWKVAEPRYDANPQLARALDVLFILHADHEQNCGTTAMRTVGSAHADPYVSTAAAAAALYGPRHGGANEAVIHMLTEIGSLDARTGLHRVREGGQGPAAGLRPPRLQELRPAGQDHQADGRRGLRHHRQEPAARHRAEARGGGAVRRVLHVAAPLPERRLLLGPHLPGDGLPGGDVHGPVRHPPHSGVAGALGRAPRAGPAHRATPPAVHGRRRARRTSRSTAGAEPSTTGARGHHRRRRARVA